VKRAPKRVRTVFQDCPKFMAPAKRRTSSDVLRASTPANSQVIEYTGNS
jgi:hypothetical protein